MDNKIKNILIRNSDLLKKNKINFIKLFNNYQTGGEKDFLCQNRHFKCAKV